MFFCLVYKGFGQEYGEMIIGMTNHLEQDLNVLYVEVLPWYVRPYFHTIQIIVNKSTPNEYSIQPGKKLKVIYNILT